jgi:hypothetical protein
MTATLAVLAVTISAGLLGWIGSRDPKRLRACATAGKGSTPLASRHRRLLTVAALLPGVVLMFTGWWSAFLIWLGATVTLAWLLVLWLCRSRGESPTGNES